MVTTSKTYQKIEQHNSKVDGAVFVTAEQISEISAEITQNYVAQTVTDENYISFGDELSVARIIYQTLSR